MLTFTLLALYCPDKTSSYRHKARVAAVLSSACPALEKTVTLDVFSPSPQSPELQTLLEFAKFYRPPIKLP